MAAPPASAPVLSTPDTHIFEDPTPTIDTTSVTKISEEQLWITYEIRRTAQEIRENRWTRIALQFPDEMLADAPRVYEGLEKGLKRTREAAKAQAVGLDLQVRVGAMSVADRSKKPAKRTTDDEQEKIFILADTSYGSCCVDEVAAEHVDAEVVVHYGRSCLSPTARLPVLDVYTTKPLDLERVVRTFKETYQERSRKVVLMADIPYSSHIPVLGKRLVEEGYTAVFATSILHDPSAAIPNRTVPSEVSTELAKLREYSIFHISDPPASLLLTLSSRADAIHICPTAPGAGPTKAMLASSAATLRRRYALVTSLSTCSIFGILINTLSVKNYMHIVEHVKQLISAAGKKSYTFVVGKVNAAKVANFSEIGGWVIIGCWESSLMESKEFYRPIITPFELSLALKSDSERMWTGDWTSDFEAVLKENVAKEDGRHPQTSNNSGDAEIGEDDDENDLGSEDEPPEFDLRTGRYISHTRPMRTAKGPTTESSNAGTSSHALTKRANGDLIQIGGVASPGAAFLRENRTWKGLGSEHEIAYQDDTTDAAARVEEGRSGIARGYTHSSGEAKS